MPIYTALGIDWKAAYMPVRSEVVLSRFCSASGNAFVDLQEVTSVNKKLELIMDLISAFDALLLGCLLQISSRTMRVCCSSLPTSRFDRICSKNVFTYQCNRHLSCKGCFRLKAMS
ncbi:hypothetical protein SCARR_05247 [Pontiella sulfatireligans]|uniref:Uncharacterized protein n=1 Tax=Pontiella sulfatireligans TaxID=2750658 RepID=A0A6C2US35_9BACT|nr:hypothetical protein SCARR_05247 [Pontiella sulfatireligans]